MMNNFICKKCGKEYKRYNKTSSFCSITCRNTFYSNKLINKKFGKLKVIDTRIHNNHTQCLCICDCGNEIWVKSGNLKNNHTQSCGCYQKEIALKNNLHYLKKYQKENHVEKTNLGNLNSSIFKNNQTGTKGVYWHSQSQKWTAKLTFQGKTYLKRFSNIEDAIKYRKELEEKYFKPILDKYDKK